MDQSKSSKPEAFQDEEYGFPYHYIPEWSSGGFSQVRSLSWGYMYLARLQRVVEIVRGWDFDSLLDVGCGDGRFLYELHKAMPEKSLSGIDFSESPLRFARAFNPDLEFLRGNIAEDRGLMTKKYDAITLVEVIEHIPGDQLGAFIEGVARRLNPSGRLLLTTPTDNIPVSKKHYQHFNLQKLEQLLGERFTITRTEYFHKPLAGMDKFKLRLLSNRLFVTVSPAFVSSFYRRYCAKYFSASAHDAADILVIATRLL